MTHFAHTEETAPSSKDSLGRAFTTLLLALAGVLTFISFGAVLGTSAII